MSILTRVYNIKHCLKASVPIRCISTTTSLSQSRALAKLKKMQAEFQCENGIPIFLKCGLRDRLLYSSTLVGCVVGLFMTVVFLYDQAKPPSWKTGASC